MFHFLDFGKAWKDVLSGCQPEFYEPFSGRMECTMYNLVACFSLGVLISAVLLHRAYCQIASESLRRNLCDRCQQDRLSLRTILNIISIVLFPVLIDPRFFPQIVAYLIFSGASLYYSQVLSRMRISAKHIALTLLVRDTFGMAFVFLTAFFVLSSSEGFEATFLGRF